jgi:membrane-associated phospholipid phosphatase
MQVLLAEAGKKWQVWPGHPWFPSGHEAFAASAAACLVLLYGRAWLTAALPAAGLMGWALVAAGYHAVPDVLAAAVYGPLAAALLLRLTGGPVRPPRAA